MLATVAQRGAATAKSSSEQRTVNITSSRQTSVYDLHNALTNRKTAQVAFVLT